MEEKLIYTNINTYRRMAYMSYKEYCKYTDKVENLRNDPSTWVMGKDKEGFENAIWEKQYELAVSVIIFSAFSIEALCNDYISRNLGFLYNDYLDKLDVKSKLIVSIKLITGRDFPKDVYAYNVLNNLIGVRNKIAHSKSIKIELDTLENIEKSFKNIGNSYQTSIDKKIVDDSIKAFDLIIKEMGKLDQELYIGYKNLIEDSIDFYYDNS